MLLAVAAGNALADAAQDFHLFDSFEKLDPATIHTTDATVAKVKSGRQTVLQITTMHKAAWPGIVMAAPEGHWDISRFGRVVVSVKNTGSNSVTVSCRVDNPGADGTDHCRTGEISLEPQQSGRLFVDLRRTSSDDLGGKLFGMRGYPVKRGGSGTIDPSNVTQLLVFVGKPNEDHHFEVSEFRATGVYTPPTAWTSDAAPFFPFIDTFGQYSHKNWPGKTKSLADLTARRSAEAAELAREPGPYDWDEYGGWKIGPTLRATGFFRTEKYRGKWWLVDPDGYLFFSNGIDCVGYGDRTPIDERERWFAGFPGKKPTSPSFCPNNSRSRAIMPGYRRNVSRLSRPICCESTAPIGKRSIHMSCSSVCEAGASTPSAIGLMPASPPCV